MQTENMEISERDKDEAVLKEFLKKKPPPTTNHYPSSSL